MRMRMFTFFFAFPLPSLRLRFFLIAIMPTRMRLKRKRVFANRPRKRRPAPLRRTRRITKFRGSRGFKGGVVRDRRIVTMRYAETFELTAVSVVVHKSFRANGLFDPDVSVGGHQPRGFDQFMALYDRFMVLSATLNIKAFSTSTNPWFISCRVQDSADTLDSSLTTGVLETKGNNVWRVTAADANNFPARMRITGAPARFYNKSIATQLNDPNMQGTSLADPVTQLFFNLTAGRAGNVDAADIKIICWIDYKVMMLDPTQVANS